MRPETTKRAGYAAGAIAIVLGTAFIFVPVTVTETSVVNQQDIVCQQTINSGIASLQTLSYQCEVIGGGWAKATLTSKQHLSYTVTFAKKAGGGGAVLDSTSGTTFTMNLPIISNGTLTLQITNTGSSTGQVSGSYVSAYQASALYPYPQVRHPLRDPGAALFGLGCALVFLLAWDPRGLGTRAVGMASGKSAP